MNRVCDVAIVGCGPTGALLANILGQYGLTVAIFERQRQIYDLPRAVHFDGEVMRIFQSVALADQVFDITRVNKGMVFRNAQGDTLVSWPRDQHTGDTGWHESYRFHQPALEKILRHGLARFANVQLELGSTVTHVEDVGGLVVLTLDDGRKVEAAFAVACDGAQSFMRGQMGIQLDDLGFRERWLVVDLALKRPRPDLGDFSVQYCDPEKPATYVRGTGDRRRWEFRIDGPGPGEFSEDEIWQRLERWITPDDAIVERFAIYTFRSVLAVKWRRGRIFLAGDAAHLMPPFMGQGMCAGMRDAANLGWKLAAVCRGFDDFLLETYESERRPNVRQYIDLSVRLGRLINRTMTGQAPSGRMSSIWPGLGPGVGPRDRAGGQLVPQIETNGHRSDDIAPGGFYVVSRRPIRSELPLAVGAKTWLADRGLLAAVVRPDGYALAGIRNSAEIDQIGREHRALWQAVAPR